MTASTRQRAFVLVPYLVLAAAMHSARLGAQEVGDRFPSPRRVFTSVVAFDIDTVGQATPTAAERNDGYVAIGEVTVGDSPGEWVATTPHGAHWFDAQWRQTSVTDLGRRYREVRPVRFERDGPVSLVAIERSVNRFDEFDRTGHSRRRVALGKSLLAAFGDFDADGSTEYAAPAGKTVRWWRRAGEPWMTTPLNAFVDEVDTVPGEPGKAASLLVYSFLSPRKGTRLEVVTPTGARRAQWDESGSARYSVVELRGAQWFVSHQSGMLRLRDAAGRPASSRQTLYDVRTRYARGLTLASGHDVLLCFNRHFATSVLVVYDQDGKLVHAEHPGAFASALWAVPGDPDAFYVAVGPRIVRYHLRR